MGNTCRNFGGGSASDPLQPYYVQLTTLASEPTYTRINSVANGLYNWIGALVALASNQGAIMSVVMSLLQPKAGNLSQFISEDQNLYNWTTDKGALNAAYGMLRDYYWGQGRPFLIEITGTAFVNNDYLQLRDCITTGGDGDSSLVYFETQVDEFYVATPGRITVDIRGLLTTDAIAEAFWTAISANTNKSYDSGIFTAPSVIVYRSSAVGSNQNNDVLWLPISSSAQITVTPAGDGFDGLFILRASAAEISYLKTAANSKILSVDSLFNPGTNVDWFSTIAGKQYTWTPGTKLVTPERKSFTYKGRPLGQGVVPDIFKPDFRIEEQFIANNAEGGDVLLDETLTGAGKWSGPFTMLVDGFFKSADPITAILCVNGNEIRGNNVYAKYTFTRRGVAGQTTSSFHRHGDESIHLTGDINANNANQDANIALPFTLKAEFANPRHIAGRRRLVTVTLWFIGDRTDAVDSEQVVNGEFFFVDPSDTIGEITSVGFRFMSYNEMTGYNFAGVAYDARMALSFNS